MSDSFREVTSVSWFGRIKRAVGGVIFGLILIVLMVIGLFWNEGRAVQTARSLAEGSGAVVSVPMPGPREAVRAAELCLDNGVRVGSFRPPTVPDGISRLRLTAHAGLSDEDLDHACAVILAAIGQVS